MNYLVVTNGDVDNEYNTLFTFPAYMEEKYSGIASFLADEISAGEVIRTADTITWKMNVDWETQEYMITVIEKIFSELTTPNGRSINIVPGQPINQY